MSKYGSLNGESCYSMGLLKMWLTISKAQALRDVDSLEWYPCGKLLRV